MLQNATAVRGGSVARVDTPPINPAGDDGRGIAQLAGRTAQAGQIGAVVVNPLHGAALTPATHYLDRNG